MLPRVSMSQHLPKGVLGTRVLGMLKENKIYMGFMVKFGKRAKNLPKPLVF